jgi:hypothetical protein
VQSWLFNYACGEGERHLAKGVERYDPFFVIPTIRAAKRRNLLFADSFVVLSRKADSSSSLRSLSE